RMVNDVTTIVLDRPRHHDLIEEIRVAGARIKLIQDGDVLASISAAVRGTNDHLAIGIGGTRQAVLSAAALRCLGGELQAQLWPTRRAEIDSAREHGIEDLDRIFTIDDLAPQEEVVEALRQVEDPELGMDIVELGLFYNAEIDGPKVKVQYTLTSMGCPAGAMIQEDIDRVVAQIPGVETVESELTFDPPWSP